MQQSAPRLLLALLTAALFTTAAPSQNPASFERFGAGCPGSSGVPSLDAAEGILPRIGETFTAEFSNLPAGASPSGLIALIGLSNSLWAGMPLPLDLSPFGITDCTLHVSIRRTIPLLVSDTSSSTSWQLNISDDSSLIGVQFFTQGLVLDPNVNSAGYIVTNAAEGVIGANTGPAATIIFPTKVALTDADSILVRGTAVDPSGIAEVSVNGQLAASSDGFANWQVRVPLPPGFTDLTVATRDALGFIDTEAARARIRSQADMLGPSAIALDLPRGRAVVLDTSLVAVLSIDLATGHRRVLSDAVTGSGPQLVSPTDIVLAFSINRALVTDSELDAVLSIDLVTGDREILSGIHNGVGPSLTNPQSLALDGMRVLVVSNHLNAPEIFSSKLIEVDLATGNRRIISDGATARGVSMGNPHGVIVDGYRALVVDSALYEWTVLGFVRINDPSLISINLATGFRTRVSGIGRGAGVEFEFPERITLNGSRALIVDNGRQGVLAVDLTTGNRVVVSSSSLGAGPDLLSPRGIVAKETFALLADFESPALLLVDLVSGDRHDVSRVDGTGAGLSLGLVSGIVTDGDRLILADRSNRGILAVEIATGDRSIVSDANTGTGTAINTTGGLALTRDRAIVIVNGEVHTVDLATGNRMLVSGPARGDGLRMNSPRQIAIDGTRALVTTVGNGFLTPGITSVDLETGDRTVVSGNGVGTGAEMNPSGILIDGRRAIVVDIFPPRIVAVELETGDRTDLSSSTLGSGPVFSTFGSIAKYESRIVVGVLDALLAIDLETGDREVLSGARSEIPGDTLGMGPSVSFGGQTVAGSLAFVARAQSRNGIHGATSILAIDLETGERVILSK